MKRIRTEYSKLYYQTHREKRIANQLKYNRNHKEKIKNSRLKRIYNISIDEYNNILLTQNNRCAICKKPLDLQNPKHVHIDHDHKTGKVRGILCNKCNSAIGYLNDNIEYIKNALEYLEHNKR